MKLVVEGRSLFKKFQDKTALSGIHFQVQEGECFGVLGATGAGKSTLLRLIGCGTPPTSGDLFVLGYNAKENPEVIKGQIGIVPQEGGYDPQFTVRENLELFGFYQKVSRHHLKAIIRGLLRDFELEKVDGEVAENLPLPLQRRLSLARALVSSPKLLLLDEPLTQLPAREKDWTTRMLSRLVESGTTVIWSTPYLDRAEALCDRVCILDRGRVVAMGEPERLISEMIGRDVVEFDLRPEDADYWVRKIKDQFKYQLLNRRLHVFVNEHQQSRTALDLINSETVVLRKGSLRDVFIKTIGFDLKEDL